MDFPKSLYSYHFVSANAKQWHSVTTKLFYVNEFENEKIISQFIEIIKCLDQSGDRV